MALPAYLAAAAGAQIVGGLLGGAASQGDRDRAFGISQEVYDAYKNLKLPDIKDLEVYLQQLQSQGIYSPEEIQVIGERLASDYENIQTDQALRDQQTSTIDSLNKIAKTGMSDIDKAQLEGMLRKSAAQENANTQSILENRARRGMAGSGDELAAALSGTQAASNRRSAEALEIAAMSAKRRQDAMLEGSNLASKLEQQDYARRANLAEKRDSRQDFNQALKQRVLEGNVGNRNEAQQLNLREKQRIADSNVNLSNQQQLRNKDLIQQNFENNLKRLAGMSGSGSAASDAAQRRADATAGMYTGIANAIAVPVAQLGKNKAQSDKEFDEEEKKYFR